jgi:hypothetical protein
MLAFIKGLFGVSSVVDSATKIVDRIAGTDWLPQQKADFLLQYMEATKHQSPARRFIATMIAMVWLLMTVSWLVSSVVGRFIYDEALNPGTVLAADISAFMNLNINEGFGLILMFYFGVHGVSVLSGAIGKGKA